MTLVEDVSREKSHAATSDRPNDAGGSPPASAFRSLRSSAAPKMQGASSLPLKCALVGRAPSPSPTVAPSLSAAMSNGPCVAPAAESGADCSTSALLGSSGQITAGRDRPQLDLRIETATYRPEPPDQKTCERSQ